MRRPSEPYAAGGGERRYRPDFILKVDDGNGPADPLHLIIEIKGYRRIDAPNIRQAMETHWVPTVNNHGGFGRWTFLEIGHVHRAEAMICLSCPTRYGVGRGIGNGDAC